MKSCAMSLVIIIMLGLCGCGQAFQSNTQVPVSSTTATPSAATSWLLSHESTQLQLEIEDNSLYITSLCDPKSGYEWLSGKQIVSLPEYLGTYEGDAKGEHVQLNWQYKGAEVAHDNGTTLTLTFENALPAFSLQSVWNATVTDGPITHTVYINNNSGINYFVYKQPSLELEVKNELDLNAWTFSKENYDADVKGVYINNLNKSKDVMAQTTLMVDVAQNCGLIPLMLLQGTDKGLYIGWEWPHGGIRALQNGDNVSLKAGLNSTFQTVIAPGTRFLVPAAYIGAYTGDADEGSNIFRHWFLWEKAPKKLTADYKEPLTQIGAMLDCVSHDFTAMGIESMVWDYGWWKGEGVYGEGSWIFGASHTTAMAQALGCTTLREYTDIYRSKGINYTLYLLTHDALNVDGTVNPAEPQFNSVAHPEWFSSRKASKDYSADLGNEECVQYLKNRLCSYLTDNGVSTWRIDMETMPWASKYNNRHVCGLVDTSYWNAVGFYEIADYLYENVQDFRLEVSGSGGAYKDFATLRRATVMQTEDRADYNTIRKVFYTSSYAINAAQLLSVCNPDTFNKNSQYYVGPGDMDYGMRSIIMGVPHLYSWERKQDGHLLDGLEEQITRYYGYHNKYISVYQKYGKLYHILPRPDGVNWDGMQYYCDDASLDRIGVVFLFKPSEEAGISKTVYLKGLDPDSSYSLVFEDRPEQNCTRTGRTLMENGLDVSIEQAVGSEMIWILRG